MEDLAHDLLSPETGAGESMCPDYRVFRRLLLKTDPRLLRPVNEGAFSLDTEESAYWAGFLIADGCISVPQSGSPSVSINLMACDKTHLILFRAFLGATTRSAMRFPNPTRVTPFFKPGATAGL